jgi:hypothetical protein
MGNIETIKIFLNPVNITTGVLVTLITYRVIKKLFVKENKE